MVSLLGFGTTVIIQKTCHLLKVEYEVAHSHSMVIVRGLAVNKLV